jgi:uncharacterized SAM-binding protein YcdF (DUF218 family)/lysophospholipase L1-like esterase
VRALIGRRQFLSGIACGIALVFVLRAFVNETVVADWLVSPLLIDDTDGAAEAIVVPGAAAIGDCSTNLTGLHRALRAARLWKQSRGPLVVIAGSAGDGNCPVSIAMARIAQDAGVPLDRVRVETASRSTRENAENLAPLLRAWGIHRIVLVTDRLHMRRAAGVFGNLGFDVERSSVPIFEGHADNVSMLRAGLREFAALAYYRARGWTTAPDRLHAEATVNIPQSVMRSTGPIVILGASYAKDWPLPSISGVPVINKGIAGQQSFELLERFERDVVAEAPRAVVVWGFINDIFRSPEERMDATVERIRTSYMEIVRLSRERGIVPILATEITARPQAGALNTLRGWAGAIRGKAAYQDRINVHVTAVNAWLKEFAAREKLMVLDLQSVLAEPGGRRRVPFAQPDGSHVTGAGYDLLTSYAQPILEAYLSVD